MDNLKQLSTNLLKSCFRNFRKHQLEVLYLKNSQLLKIYLNRKISRDLKYIIFAKDMSNIEIWDWTKEKCICTKKIDEPGKIYSLIRLKSKLGNKLIAIGTDTEIKIYDWGYACYKAIIYADSSVNCLVSLKDENNHYVIGSGHYNKIIKIWNYEHSTTCLATLLGHENSISSLINIKFYNMNLIASGSTDKSIKIWDWKINNCLTTLLGHQNNVRCLVNYNTTEESFIASGSWDNKIIIWSWIKGLQIQTLNGHTDSVRCMVYFYKENKHIIISGSDDCTIKLWDISIGACIKTIDKRQGFVRGLLTLYRKGDEILFASLCLQHKIDIWNFDNLDQSFKTITVNSNLFKLC
jgi:WD40 repeat protein